LGSKSFHAVIVTGGDEKARENLALELLSEHFADDAEAVQKLKKGVFEDLVRVVPGPAPKIKIDEKNKGKIDTKRGTILFAPEPIKSDIIAVGQIASLVELFAQQAFISTGKAAIFERAERMKEEAQNKFLKLLEEPPAGALFILLTENPEKLLLTVRSRCIVHRIKEKQQDKKYDDYSDDIKELARILVLGKAAIPYAWQICEKHSTTTDKAIAFARDFEEFAAFLARTGGPAGKLREQERAVCRQLVFLADEAAQKIEKGGNAKSALKDITLLQC